MALGFDAVDAERGQGCTGQGHLCCSYLSSLFLFVLLEGGSEVSVWVLVTSWGCPAQDRCQQRGAGLFPLLRSAGAGLEAAVPGPACPPCAR